MTKMDAGNAKTSQSDNHMTDSHLRFSGQREHLAGSSMRGDPVHVGNPCGLKRRAAAQFGEGLVGHAVAEEENCLCVFHSVLYVLHRFG